LIFRQCSAFPYILSAVSHLKKEYFIIENGERIAQLVIAKHEQPTWEEVDVLSSTDRGAGGFGSTGNN
jgi:dUTP pyrophosphatase